MKKLTGGLLLAVLAFGVGTLGNAATSEAGTYVIYSGGYSGYGAGYGGVYRSPYTAYRPYGNPYGGSVGPVWHDTSHYHYQPSRVVPHGNHLHYTPGHYDLHRTGHWHP